MNERINHVGVVLAGLYTNAKRGDTKAARRALKIRDALTQLVRDTPKTEDHRSSIDFAHSVLEQHPEMMRSLRTSADELNQFFIESRIYELMTDDQVQGLRVAREQLESIDERDVIAGCETMMDLLFLMENKSSEVPDEEPIPEPGRDWTKISTALLLMVGYWIFGKKAPSHATNEFRPW